MILYIFLSVFIVSLISFVGIFFISVKEENMKKLLPLLIALSTGSLLGGAFIHLLPELVENSPTNFSSTSFLILFGIILFYLIEKVLHWHHHHTQSESDHCNSCKAIELKE